MSSHFVVLLTSSTSSMLIFYLACLFSLILYTGIKSHFILATYNSYHQTQVPEYCFVLNEQGVAQFSSQERSQGCVLKPLILAPSSRKGLCGCRLNFVAQSKQKNSLLFDHAYATQQTTSDKIIKSIFIYKDSVSEQDYRRICRVLYAVKQAEP